MSESEGQYVTMVEAAQLVGVSRATISRRIAAGEIAVFYGSDRRQRLLRRADVVGLAQVRALNRQATAQGVSR